VSSDSAKKGPVLPASKFQRPDFDLSIQTQNLRVPVATISISEEKEKLIALSNRVSSHGVAPPGHSEHPDDPVRVPDLTRRSTTNVTKKSGFGIQLEKIQEDFKSTDSHMPASSQSSRMEALPIIPKTLCQFRLPPKCPLENINFI
jgi:hypothetical protein